MNFVMSCCLELCHITVILPLVLIGLFSRHRNTLLQATFLLFFVMIFNTLLKYLFKVPLLPHLGDGYSFPSGHMHASGIFYAYLLIKSRNNIVKGILLGLILGIACSLVYFNYHRWEEIFGA